jgi:adenosine deaminase
MDKLIAALPKAELHMHLEGSLEHGRLFELAERNGVELPWKDPAELAAAYRFENLQSFLDLYYLGCKVLVTREDFYLTTRDYLWRAHEDNIVHAEIFLSPQGHTSRGVSMATIMDGVLAAFDEANKQFGMTGGVLLGAQRHLPEAQALAMLEAAMPWADRILGFGLGGAELGNPPSGFTRYARACRERGFHVTAHAGEEGPASYVREALELLQVDRVDHGNAAMNDPDLLADLVRTQTPLTVCPLSNLKLQVVTDMREHPLRKMLRAGLRVTINSDDPSYFGGYLNDNLLACRQHLGLTDDEVYTLMRNGFLAAFLPERIRAAYLLRLEQAYQRHCASRLTYLQ